MPDITEKSFSGHDRAPSGQPNGDVYVPHGLVSAGMTGRPAGSRFGNQGRDEMTVFQRA